MPSQQKIANYKDIPGWFGELDRRVFSTVLESQRDSPPGELVEIGVFRGKSAVVIGDYLRDDERFVVIDLFGDMGSLGDSEEDEANRRENQKSYRRLDRQAFEDNYLMLHSELPVVLQGLSSEIVKHVEPQSARFIHVDASHLYPGVSVDCQSTKRLLRPGGIAAFDDYRNAKVPGVAAAVWEAVFKDGMIPVALTPKKLYGVYDNPEPYAAALRAMANADPDWFLLEEHEALGRKVLRLDRKPPAAKPTSAPGKRAATAGKKAGTARKKAGAGSNGGGRRPAPKPGAKKAAVRHPAGQRQGQPTQAGPAPSPTTLRGKLRRTVARDLAPPALTRWLMRRRRDAAGGS
jgi:hypothetical protein